jgi:hypothetical protein
VFRRISWLSGGGGLTAPYTRSNRPLWTASFRVVSAVVGVCVLRLLVVLVPRTISTPVATWFWQTEGRSVERVILGVRPSEFILSEFQSPLRGIFIGSRSLPPLWSPNRSFTPHRLCLYTSDGRRQIRSNWTRSGRFDPAFVLFATARDSMSSSSGNETRRGRGGTSGRGCRCGLVLLPCLRR